jgi:acyl carrier protein
VAVVDPGAGTPPPIGRPVGNTEAYLLDPQLRPVPPGAAGELYLGGRGLARGYLGQPGLTAGRFVPSPFGPAGARLYRTGDLCRFRADGQLAYLGRRDHQVKVRGYRVEPEETEAVLREHPDIAEAAVTARGQALAGYAVPRDSARPDSAAVLAFLRTRLPGHMIPATLTILDAIPRTPNGKTDRAALPPPHPTPTHQQAPRTHAEEVIAAIFAGKLGLPDVGVHDDFCELGGHSLLATEVVAEVREASGAGLPLRVFFQAPTVADLAEAVERASAGAPDRSGPEMAALIGEIEGLSDEQARAELDRLESATERTRREA